MDLIEAAGGTEAIMELIGLMKTEPRLWDRTSPSFITHNDVKLELFTDIANRLNLLGVTGDTVTTAWRQLSEKYRRRLYDGKRRNGTTSWPFFEPMSFLRDQYEQTRWHRTSALSSCTIAHNAQQHASSPANVAQLVNTILNAHHSINASEAETMAAVAVACSDETTSNQDRDQNSFLELKRQISPCERVESDIRCNGTFVGEIIKKGVPQQEIFGKQGLMNAALRLFSSQRQPLKNDTKCRDDNMVMATTSSPSSSCVDAMIEIENRGSQDQIAINDHQQPSSLTQQLSFSSRAQQERNSSSNSPIRNIDTNTRLEDIINSQISSVGATMVTNNIQRTNNDNNIDTSRDALNMKRHQIGRRKARNSNRFCAFNKPKNTRRKQAFPLPTAVGNTAFACEMSPQYGSVANSTEQSQSDDAKTLSCHATVAERTSTNTSPTPHQQSVIDSDAKWENVGRVWIDMMKTVRSPQLALAAHKFVTNTLFAVLEADTQLLGVDPSITRVRIRENAPQIEVTMHQ
ncbi:unnamed protein product [Anisakis simplex]|uniref:MADF domain-containing protein n=1 Tax=Anisakis simplex TaxID=6269 RepID=A0A0M3JUG2_ANISI|nr:unnamed protein product [Anisakis simplex]